MCWPLRRRRWGRESGVLSGLVEILESPRTEVVLQYNLQKRYLIRFKISSGLVERDQKHGSYCAVSKNFLSQRAPYLQEEGLDNRKRGTFVSSPPRDGSGKLWRRGRGGWGEGQPPSREGSPREGGGHIVLMDYFASLTNFPYNLIYLL